ncbi:MAG: carbohydrate porin, partial [Elusimicrobiota bacterium]|nr:carbohydrate porin [Elusimicrobiota bacterium]
NIGFYAASQKAYDKLKNDGKSTEDVSIDQASYRFELYLNKAFEDGGRAVLRLRGGDRDFGNLGLGIFRGSVNDQSFWQSPDHDAIIIRELYFTQPLFDKIAYFKIGKMQPPTSSNNALNSVGSFFTDDATVQNVDGILGSYGIEIGATPIPLITLSYTYLGQDTPVASNSNVTKGPFSYGYHTFLANFKPIAKGNYRVGFWASAIKRQLLDNRTVTLNASDRTPVIYDDPDDTEYDGSSGIYISIDQVVADNFTLGLRFGQRLDKTAGLGAAQPGMAWDLGGTISGKLWSRGLDSFFLGVGQATYQKDYYGPDANVPDPELHLEVNYVFAFNDSFSLTPFFQYASNISPFVNDKNDWEYQTGMAYGLRTQIKF